MLYVHTKFCENIFVLSYEKDTISVLKNMKKYNSVKNGVMVLVLCTLFDNALYSNQVVKVSPMVL